MRTLRQELDRLGFDWNSGRIIYEPVKDPENDSPGWAYGDDLLPPIEIDKNAKVLDREWYAGYGGPQCPRIVARDRHAVYFPWQYDGSSGLVKVHIHLGDYLNGQAEFPYPGV